MLAKLGARNRAEAVRPIIDDRLQELLGLIGGADSVELKLTVPESNQRSAVRSLGEDVLTERSAAADENPWSSAVYALTRISPESAEPSAP